MLFSWRPHIRPRTCRGSSLLVAALCAVITSLPAQASQPLLLPSADGSRSLTIEASRAAWLARSGGREAFALRGVALRPGLTVDLDLERFTITGPRTQFVLGRPGSGSSPLAFDPDRVLLLRGTARGYAGSRVFLTISDSAAYGTIELGGVTYRVSSPANRAPRSGGLLPDLPLCAADLPLGPVSRASRRDSTEAGIGMGSPPPTIRVVELAVETDYELFELFGDLDATGDYVVQLYAAVSEIFLRDVNARLELVFLRLWDDPDDMFNEENPIGPFRFHWNEHMGGVERDVAQFFSGRRNFPYGGAAYLASLCTTNAYSVVGYATGSFDSIDAPTIGNYDLAVTAHELGHNFAANHTHAYMIDDCDDLHGTPQRGTLMSYCSQTVSGGNANTDPRFHSFVQDVIEEYLPTVDCAYEDCNGNGIDDSLDLAEGGSEDVNANGMPDECEDCNENDFLDSTDILLGTSLDLNVNGLPDECEPDCNDNDVPDDLDIADGTSQDAHGNGIPDECEDDCDGNGVSDYNQIQIDLSLDVNRNTILDSCEDCDGDGELDADALDGANSVWAVGLGDGRARGFHSLAGVVSGISAVDQFVLGQDVVVDATGRIFVSSAGDHRVVEFDRSGATVGDFVTAGSGGLSDPSGMTIGPDGNLYVSSRGNDSVLAFDGATGAPLRSFVGSGSGGLVDPYGLAFGPNGNLFVASVTNEVKEYDGESGAFVGDFVSTDDNGGLSGPRGLAFKTDGHLLVASYDTNQVLEFDRDTGDFLGQFNKGGTATALTMDEPWGIRVGPDGDVYVSRHDVEAEHEGAVPFFSDPIQLHINSSRIYIFDGTSGIFLRSYVTGNDTGFDFPTGFDFLPDLGGVDCNLNAVPDACDIASGTSQDGDENGVPDECETVCPQDFNGNGIVEFGDLLAILAAWGPCGASCPEDLDGNGEVGFGDLLSLLAAWGPCGAS